MTDIRSLIERLDQINEASGVDDAIKRIIDKRGVPKNIEELEQDVAYTVKYIRDQLQSRDSDSFFQGIERGFKRATLRPDYIQRQYLGTVAEKLGLPGLFTIPDGNYVYTDKDQGGQYKSAANASVEEAVQIYKSGFITRDKAAELRKDNLGRATRDSKSLANEFFKEPGPAAVWNKTNPLPDTVGGSTSGPASGPITGVVPAPGGKDGAPPAQAPSTILSKKISSEELANIDGAKAEQMAGELIKELEKILKVLKDSKLIFKSSIALSLIESDKLYERDLSGPEEEAVKTIIFNLEMLGPKLSAETNNKITDYRKQIPAKYVGQVSAVPSVDIKQDNIDAADPKIVKVTPPEQKITWKDLIKLNPSIKNPNLIYPGQEIKLPGGSSAVVGKGDSLSKIAQMWNSGAYADGEDDVDSSAPNQSQQTDKPAAAPAPAGSAPVQKNKPADAPGNTNRPASATGPANTTQFDPAVPAKTIYDAVNGMGTDEDKVQAGLKQIANISQWQQSDKAAKSAYGQGLLDLILGDISTPDDLITYVYPELRRINVPHTAEVRRLDQINLKQPFDKSIAPFYDAQGNFPPKGPAIKDDPNWRGTGRKPAQSPAPATTTNTAQQPPKINPALVPPGSR